MKANRQEVGSRLKQLRMEKGMTMAQVADALHVSSNAVVNNWEKENKKISPKFLKAYADYFNVSIDWIKYGMPGDTEAYEELEKFGNLEVEIVFYPESTDDVFDMTVSPNFSPECYGYLLKNLGENILQNPDAYRPSEEELEELRH